MANQDFIHETQSKLQDSVTVINDAGEKITKLVSGIINSYSFFCKSLAMS